MSYYTALFNPAEGKVAIRSNLEEYVYTEDRYRVEVPDEASRDSFRIDGGSFTVVGTLGEQLERGMEYPKGGPVVTLTTIRGETIRGTIARIHGSLVYIYPEGEDKILTMVRRDQLLWLPVPNKNHVSAKRMISFDNSDAKMLMYDLSMRHFSLELMYDLVLGDDRNMLSLTTRIVNSTSMAELKLAAADLYEQRAHVMSVVNTQSSDYTRIRKAQYRVLNTQNTSREAPQMMAYSAAPSQEAEGPGGNTPAPATASRLVKVLTAPVVLKRDDALFTVKAVAENLGQLDNVMVSRSESIPSSPVGDLEVGESVIRIARDKLGNAATLPSARLIMTIGGQRNMPGYEPEASSAILDMWQQDPANVYLRFGPNPVVVVRRDMVSSQERRSSSHVITTVRVLVTNFGNTPIDVICQERVSERVTSAGGAWTARRAYYISAENVRKRGVQAMYAAAERMSDLTDSSVEEKDWEDASSKLTISPHAYIWLSDREATDAAFYVDARLAAVPAGEAGAPGVALLVYRFSRKMRV